MKKYLGIICLLYSAIIIYVWSFGLLKNYLSPQMQLYIKLSLFPLLIMGLILLFNDRFEYKFKISDLILLLPLVIILLAGDGKLSINYAINKLNVNNDHQINNNINNDNNTDTDDIIPDNTTYDFSSVDIDVIDSSYNELANYITFEKKANRFVGQKIRFKGYTIANASYLPSGYYGVGKYTITCCAADAEFAGFVVKTNNIELKENTWYEVEGVVESYNKNNIVDIIRVINIKEIDGSKEEQYVYACYAYDNGSCEEISKYNLDYE